MTDFSFRPMTAYPKKRTANPRRATFSAGYGKNLMDLERELEHLRAKCCIVEVDTTPEHIRLDGRIRSDAKLRSQAIILRIETPGGWLTMPCDTFDRWTDNLRAIVLTLTNLRAIDRYGVTTSGEQYRGFNALPPPGQTSAASTSGEFHTPEDAARFLLRASGRGVYDQLDIRRVVERETLDATYREAARRAHPDITRDNGELMVRINLAKDFIEKHAHAAA